MYTFKWRWEAFWIALMAVVWVLLQEMAGFAPPEDWHSYAINLATLCVRAAGGALIAWLGGSAVTAGRPDAAKGGR